MRVVEVRLTPWLRAQHILGEPIPERWARMAAQAGLAIAAPGQPPDVVLEGSVLTLEAPDLAEVADGVTLVLEDPEDPGEFTDAGDDRTIPRVDPDTLHRHAGLVVAAPATRADLVGTREPVLRVRALDAWRHAPVGDVSGLRAVESRELARRHERDLARGVRFVGAPPLLGPAVELEPGCTVWQGAVLLGRTRVATGAIVHTGCHLVDTDIAADAELRPYTVASGAAVGPGVTVGPFAHLREGTVLQRGARIGNFVETKKTTLGEGAKANHLAYLGDCSVGPAANVGAGTITCNYDGGRKHRTEIGAGAFVGTNSALVAPLRVGEGALVAAGSVITEDVPDGALATGRAEQRTLPGRGAEILHRNRTAKGDG